MTTAMAEQPPPQMRLAARLHESSSDPANYASFFTPREDASITKNFVQQREAIPIGRPDLSCECNLFLGFFFDGTRNSYADSERAAKHSDHSHSNVARLFDAYSGQTIAPQTMLTADLKFPDEAKYPNYFRAYIPGVATAFDEVGDDGKHWAGGLGGRYLERRVIWAMGQAINAVHHYFHRKPLLVNAELRCLVETITLDKLQLTAKPRYTSNRVASHVPANTQAHLQQILRRLHAALAPHIPPTATAKPAKIDPGIVRHIYVSAFGFSRGATAARVYTNWFLALCQLDAKMLGRAGNTLCGFPVTFDFLGLFDTVASVGLAPTSLIADGHGGPADAEVSLRVDPGVKCTHLVAAHEVRRSFALDSIAVGDRLNPGCHEIIFPGAHSDVGGGYRPGEEGVGEDPEGQDLLSRIPLAVMYREARLNGVPLKLERAREVVKKRFLVAPTTLKAFNAYVAASEAYQASHPRPGMPPLRALMRTQMELAILWRQGAVAAITRMPRLARATPAERNDLTSAAAEFQQELQRFAAWRMRKPTREVCHDDPILAACIEIENREAPGVDSERFDEWADIEQFQGRLVPADVAALLERYVHDSRALFKAMPRIGLPYLEAKEVEAALKAWVAEYDRWMKAFGSLPAVLQPSHPKYSPQEVAWIQEYKATGRLPRMKTEGRELFELGGGYLRYRRIYAGADSIRMTLRAPAERLAMA